MNDIGRHTASRHRLRVTLLQVNSDLEAVPFWVDDLGFKLNSLYSSYIDLTWDEHISTEPISTGSLNRISSMNTIRCFPLDSRHAVLQAEVAPDYIEHLMWAHRVLISHAAALHMSGLVSYSLIVRFTPSSFLISLTQIMQSILSHGITELLTQLKRLAH